MSDNVDTKFEKFDQLKKDVDSILEQAQLVMDSKYNGMEIVKLQELITVVKRGEELITKYRKEKKL